MSAGVSLAPLSPLSLVHLDPGKLFGDLRLVPGRVPGSAKYKRHHGQDSVDKSFSNKIGFNSVNSSFGSSVMWQEGFCSKQTLHNFGILVCDG